MKLESKHKRYVCTICGFTYDVIREKMHNPDKDVKPFEELPADWVCPQCGRGKEPYREI